MKLKEMLTMSPRKLWGKIYNRIEQQKYNNLYKNKYAYGLELQIQNIFDYNEVIKERRAPYHEKYEGNLMYGIGAALREYSSYSGDIYCAIEHGTPTERIDNEMEYKDNDIPVLLVHSEQRRKFLKDKTDKLMITFGPNFMPYAKPIYSEFAIQGIKKNLGKTLLIYPQHNNDTSEFENINKNTSNLIEFAKKIKNKGKFDTVIVCLYYIDIERGMHFAFEKEGWIITSAGNNKNHDFGNCFSTILRLADCVIAQSITGMSYASYLNIPAIFYQGNRKMVQEDGVIFEDAWTINGKSWLENTERDLLRLFSEYNEVTTEEQREWSAYMWGADEAKTPEEIKLILEFAKELKRSNCSVDRIKHIAQKKKYEPIRKYIEEALQYK